MLTWRRAQAGAGAGKGKGGGRRRGAPAHLTALLQRRETNQLGAAGCGLSAAQRCHVGAFLRRPGMPVACIDRMHSRAYIGQFSGAGDVFVGAPLLLRLFSACLRWLAMSMPRATCLRVQTFLIPLHMLAFAALFPAQSYRFQEVRSRAVTFSGQLPACKIQNLQLQDAMALRCDLLACQGR